MASPVNRDLARRLRGPAYTFLVATLFFQCFDYAASQRPLQLGSAVWRFAAVGTAANIVGNVLLLLLLVLALALCFSDRPALILVGSLSTLLAIALLSGTVFFALDMLQLRGQVTANAIGNFDIASGQALVRLFIEGLIAGLFAGTAFRAHIATRPDPTAPGVARSPIFRAP